MEPQIAPDLDHVTRGQEHLLVVRKENLVLLLRIDPADIGDGNSAHGQPDVLRLDHEALRTEPERAARRDELTPVVMAMAVLMMIMVLTVTTLMRLVSIDQRA